LRILTRKNRELDVKRSLLHRKGVRAKTKRINRPVKDNKKAIKRKKWLKIEKSKGLRSSYTTNKGVILHLPSKMNFSTCYSETVQYISAIRELAGGFGHTNRDYMLSRVDFSQLEKISTSAALVLTAELSKWDDIARQRIRPDIRNWQLHIVLQFYEIGFFDLFQDNPLEGLNLDAGETHFRLVKYIKGKCGDSAKARILKENLKSVIGKDVEKWIFLRGGLDEAITNVSHHAYPATFKIGENEKCWYLTGSFNIETKELKIVFYDQGIGIPKSLPASKRGEHILAFMSETFGLAEGKSHAKMLKAAVELARSSTGDEDRGKGLQDLLEFVKQRKDGYLSILSKRGLYKFSCINGVNETKSESLDRPIEGTLIIWSVTL